MAKKQQEKLGIQLERTEISAGSGGMGGVVWTVFVITLALCIYFSSKYWRHSDSGSDNLETQSARAQSQAESTPWSAPETLSTATPKPAPAEPAKTLPPTVSKPKNSPQPASANSIPAPQVALPASLTLVKPAQLAVRQDGRITGYVFLHEGQVLAPIAIEGDNLVVTWGVDHGLVPINATDLKR